MSRRSLRVALRGFLAITLTVLIGSVAADAQGRSAALEERLKGANRVVVGKVRSVNPRWVNNSHGDRLIVSRVQLDVEETFKGTAEATAWMDIEGGTLGGLTLHVSSLPTLAPGERGVFFLDPIAEGVHAPHRRGDGVLKLDQNDVVKDSTVRLTDIRALARGLQVSEKDGAR